MISLSVRPAPTAFGRSALATGEILTGVILAHTWAGGCLPSVPWMIGLAALLFAASVPVTSGRASLPWMLLGVGVAQFALHAFLAAMTGGHQHLPAATPGHADLNWRMVVAHAISAAVTAGVWTLRRRLLAWLFRCHLTASRAPATAPRLAPRPRVRPLRAQWHDLLAAPRGPPRTACPI